MLATTWKILTCDYKAYVLLVSKDTIYGDKRGITKL